MANDVSKHDALSRGGTVVYASAANTVTPNTKQFEIGPNWNALTLVIDTTAVSSASTVFKIEGVDPLTGKVFPSVAPLLASAAVTATGTIAMYIGQGLPATANVSANVPVPPIVRITATCSGTSHTFSASLLLS